MTKIKICGITNIDDALVVCELGADAIGFVFSQSPRQVSKSQAKGIISAMPTTGITKVGVFVNEDSGKVNLAGEFFGLDLVQLHGHEDVKYFEIMSGKIVIDLRVENQGDLEQIERFNFELSNIIADKYLLAI